MLASLFMTMTAVALPGTYSTSYLMMNVLIGTYLLGMVSSAAMTFSTREVNLQKSNSLATLLNEIENYYQSFIDANPGGDVYTYYHVYDNGTTLAYDGETFSEFLTTITKRDINDFIVKRHQNCLNRNNGYKCQGCSGKFLGYSSAHNCNGNNVSCCTPQGSDYGCVCYKKKQAMKMDLGSAGCCS